VAAECAFSDAEVEVRIRDFEVQTFLALKEIPPPNDVAEDPPLTSRGKTRLAKVLLIGFLFALAMLIPLGVWLYVRQRHATTQPARAPLPGGQAKPGAAVPSISFPCSGCGKKLKAQAGLAGERVKCPKCGNLVRVPETNGDQAGNFYSSNAQGQDEM